MIGTINKYDARLAPTDATTPFPKNKNKKT